MKKEYNIGDKITCTTEVWELLNEGYVFTDCDKFTDNDDIWLVGRDGKIGFLDCESDFITFTLPISSCEWEWIVYKLPPQLTHKTMTRKEIIKKRQEDNDLIFIQFKGNSALCLLVGDAIISGFGYRARLSDYNDDLTDPYTCIEDYRYDISKVYMSSYKDCLQDVLNGDTTKLDLLFDLTEPEPEEMTMEEICKELGREVKIKK